MTDNSLKTIQVNLRLFDESGSGTPSVSAQGSNVNTSGYKSADSKGETVNGLDASDQINTTGKSRSKQKNPLSNVVYGKQSITENPAENMSTVSELPETEQVPKNDPSKEFEKLIQNEYKEQFAQRTQQIIDKRFKEFKKLEKANEQFKPILDVLSQKYGVKDDLNALLNAIEEDDTHYEKEAFEKGMSVEQYKALKKSERKIAQLTTALEQKQKEENARRIYGEWIKQGEELKKQYPDFNLDKELQNERFSSLLKTPTIDMKTAYEVVHHDDIIGGAMQYTAQTIAKKVTDGVKSRQARPDENAISDQAGVIYKTDPSKLTKQDRDEITRRVLRGEKISF